MHSGSSNGARSDSSTTGASTGRPRVLAFVDYYLPGYKSGGLVRAVNNIVAALEGDVEFLIVCKDRDLGESRRYDDIRVDEWQTVGPASVYYSSPGAMKFRELRRLVRTSKYDVIYLNLFFSVFACTRILLLRRLGLLPDVPVILAPRGALSDAALAHKSFKKAAYLQFAKLTGIYQGLIWQASSQLELDSIRALARRGVIDEPDIVLTPELPSPYPIPQGGRSRDVPEGDPLRLVFLSRISTTKNLRYALEVLSRVVVPIDFDLYGPVEDVDYWRECERFIATLPPTIRVRYHGEVDHSNVLSLLAEHDLMLFPTLTENFGHTILEALQAGCPVLTSDRTPWLDLEEQGVGWVVPLENPERFREVVLQVAAMTPEARREQSQRAVAYARAVIADNRARALNVQLFAEAVASGAGRGLTRVGAPDPPTAEH